MKKNTGLKVTTLGTMEIGKSSSLSSFQRNEFEVIWSANQEAAQSSQLIDEFIDLKLSFEKPKQQKKNEVETSHFY